MAPFIQTILNFSFAEETAIKNPQHKGSELNSIKLGSSIFIDIHETFLITHYATMKVFLIFIKFNV